MASFLFLAYLVWVSWQDYKEMQVVRYSHLLGVLAVVCQVIWQKGIGDVKECLVAGLCLLMLQAAACWFKLYGFADVLVFFVCGVFLLVKKGVDKYLLAYFLMQAISGGLLLSIQLLKRNVKGMHLRRPVPYIPYISVAFFLTNMVL